jgi:GntR family transcriptional regulator, galactonate operon transcriptional repressor
MRLSDAPNTIDGSAAIPRRNLHDAIVERLGQRIVAGEFGSGLLPTEAQLAAELAVSRNALREAVKVLESKGLVDVRPRLGIRVRDAADWNLLDAQVLGWHRGPPALAKRRASHAFDVVEFRLIVEPKASRLAATRATDAEIVAISQAYTQLEKCLEAPELIGERDLVFHGSIFRASHNALIERLGRLISSLATVAVELTTQPPGSFAIGLPMHREVAEAIARRDPREAERAAQRLAASPYDDLAQRLGRSGDLLSE